MGPRAGLDRCGKYRSHRDSIHGTSRPQRLCYPGPRLNFLRSQNIHLHLLPKLRVSGLITPFSKQALSLTSWTKKECSSLAAIIDQPGEALIDIHARSKSILKLIRFQGIYILVYYIYIHQLLTTPSYVSFARRLSVTIPPSPGALVHYCLPWFIFIAGFSFITLFLVLCIVVLKVNVITNTGLLVLNCLKCQYNH